MTTNNSTIPLHRYLPPEVLFLVVAELDIRSILNLRLTCHTLYHISTHNCIWTSVLRRQQQHHGLPLPTALQFPTRSILNAEKHTKHLVQLDKTWRAGGHPNHYDVITHKTPSNDVKMEFLPDSNGRFLILVALNCKVRVLDLERKGDGGGEMKLGGWEQDLGMPLFHPKFDGLIVQGVENGRESDGKRGRWVMMIAVRGTVEGGAVHTVHVLTAFSILFDFESSASALEVNTRRSIRHTAFVPPHAVSLHGSKLAFAYHHSQFISIVDWGHSEDEPITGSSSPLVNVTVKVERISGLSDSFLSSQITAIRFIDTDHLLVICRKSIRAYRLRQQPEPEEPSLIWSHAIGIQSPYMGISAAKRCKESNDYNTQVLAILFSGHVVLLRYSFSPSGGMTLNAAEHLVPLTQNPTPGPTLPLHIETNLSSPSSPVPSPSSSPTSEFSMMSFLSLGLPTSFSETSIPNFRSSTSTPHPVWPTIGADARRAIWCQRSAEGKKLIMAVTLPNHNNMEGERAGGVVVRELFDAVDGGIEADRTGSLVMMALNEPTGKVALGFRGSNRGTVIRLVDQLLPM